jgi:hypothetical protein
LDRKRPWVYICFGKQSSQSPTSSYSINVELGELGEPIGHIIGELLPKSPDELPENRIPHRDFGTIANPFWGSILEMGFHPSTPMYVSV